MHWTLFLLNDGDHLGVGLCDSSVFSQPRKCVSNKWLYASSRLVVHCPAGRRNIPSFITGVSKDLTESSWLTYSFHMGTEVHKFSLFVASDSRSKSYSSSLMSVPVFSLARFISCVYKYNICLFINIRHTCSSLFPSMLLPPPPHPTSDMEAHEVLIKH